MHHLIDSRLEIKIYGREHKCYVLVRDGHGEYEVEITPTDNGTLAYTELKNRVPIKGHEANGQLDISAGAEGTHSL